MMIEGVGTQVDQFRFSLPSKTEEANKEEIIKRIQRRRKFLFLSHHLLALMSFVATVALFVLVILNCNLISLLCVLVFFIAWFTQFWKLAFIMVGICSCAVTSYAVTFRVADSAVYEV